MEKKYEDVNPRKTVPRCKLWNDSVVEWTVIWLCYNVHKVNFEAEVCEIKQEWSELWLVGVNKWALKRLPEGIWRESSDRAFWGSRLWLDIVS